MGAHRTTQKRTRRVKVDQVTLQDARLLEKALAEPDVRAFAIMVGALKPLPRAGQRRALTWAVDAFGETMSRGALAREFR